MKKIFFTPLFITILFFVFFGFVNLTQAETICKMTFTDTNGETHSASDWCSGGFICTDGNCGDDVYDFCVGDTHYHFGCKCTGIGCGCDIDKATSEACSYGCTNWSCDDEGCIGGECIRTCQCPDGTTCNTCKTGSPPLYCDQTTKTLINKCNSCGCPAGQDCQPDGSCVDVPPTCSWQDDGCGLGACDPSEMRQTCGPSDCLGGDCTDGTTRCQSDSSCTTICFSGQVRPYKKCVGNVCKSIDACGVNTCTDDAHCVATCSPGHVKPHKECVGTTCQSIDSCGVNACTTDYECAGGGGGGGGGGGLGADDFTGKLEPPIEHETFEDLIAAIIKFIFNVALIVAPIIIIIGAFYFVAAAGDPSKIETGKKIIFYTLIGFIIILLSRGLVKLLMEEVIEVK